MGCAMKYKSGYRLALDEAYSQTLPFALSEPRQTSSGLVSLAADSLSIAAGYPWDGASTGLPWTPIKWIRPSLVHDALYQLIRESQLPMTFRRDADEVFYRLLRENRVNVVVATVVYWAVRLLGNYFLRKGRKTKEAP